MGFIPGKLPFRKGFVFYALHARPKGTLNLFMTIIEMKKRGGERKKEKKLGPNIKFFSEINTLLLSEHIRRCGQQQAGMSQYFKTD